MKAVLNRIPEFSLRALLFLFGSLPLCVHYFNARIIGFLVRKVFRYRVDIVESNLLHSFPDCSGERRREILKDFYRHFAELLVEAIWFGACRGPKRLRRSRIVEMSNPKVLNDAYEKAESVVVLYSHTGNWELLGGIVNYNFTSDPSPVSEKNYCVVYRKFSSRLWDDIMRLNRFAPLADRDGFEGYLESKSVVRYVLKHKGERKLYNFNTDQHPYFDAPDYITVNFMGRDCDTMSAAAAVAVKMGFPVLYQSMKRKTSGHGYVLEYTPICDDASKSTAEEIMCRYYRLIERDLREQPENYLWTHNRWWRPGR